MPRDAKFGALRAVRAGYANYLQIATEAEALPRFLFKAFLDSRFNRPHQPRSECDRARRVEIRCPEPRKEKEDADRGAERDPESQADRNGQHREYEIGRAHV